MDGICLIVTKKYKIFIKPLLEEVDRYFLPKGEIVVWLFSDEEFVYNQHDYDFEIKQFRIESYGWPQATLYRYKIFNLYKNFLTACGHLFYLDIDSKIIAPVGDEIKGEGLTVTLHPGFSGLGGWGSKNINPSSNAFIPQEYWGNYVAGGFQGGRADVFLEMCKELSERIDDDEKRGTRAEHNDESHLQWYLWQHPEIPRIELHSGYTMVESEYLRANWKIDHLPVKIIALDKNHSEIRS